MKKSLLLALVASAFVINAHAKDFNGVDVTGEANFDINSLGSGSNAYPGSGAAQNEQYRFNNAQLQIKKDANDISFFARLNYTPTQVGTSTTSKSSLGTIDQLEVMYKINPQFALGFGRFTTTLGFESLMKSENQFYTPCVGGQSLVPGYFEGIRLKYTPTEWLSVNLSSYNQGNNNAYADDYSQTKAHELGVAGVTGNLSWFAGTFYSIDKNTSTPAVVINRSMNDAWMTYKFNDYFSASVIYDNRIIKTENSSTEFAESTSAQVAYTQGLHTFGLRYESIYGADKLNTLTGTSDYYASGIKQVNIINFNDKIAINDNLKLYVEYRRDTADQELLTDKSNQSKKNLDMFTVAASVYF